MATLDAGLLALIVFLALCVCGLFSLGIYSIRRGLLDERQAPPDASTAEATPMHWHEQPKILFGLNNVTFALLLLAILFLSLFTSLTVHYVFFAFIGIFLIISIILVIRTMLASLAMTRRLQMRHLQTKPKADN